MFPPITKERYFRFVDACREQSRMPMGPAPSVVAAAFSELDARGLIDQEARGYGEAKGFAEHVQLIDGGPLSAAANYSDDELRAIVLEPLDNFRSGGEYGTSVAMGKVALSALDVQPEESLADLGCGLGEFMVAATRASKPSSFFGIDTYYDVAKVTQMRSIVLGLDADVEVDDVFRMNRTFNKVFCDCPLGLRRRLGDATMPADRIVPEGIKLHSMEWAFCLKAALCVTDKGTGVGVVTMGALSNLMDEQVRAYMTGSGLIRAIIALPSGMMLPSASVACAMVVMGHGNSEVRFVDATDLGRREGARIALSEEDVRELAHRLHDGGERVADVEIDELESSRWNLAPARHLRHVEVKGGVALSSLAEVRRGVPVRLEERRSERATPYRFMMIKDVGKGEVSPNLPYLTELKGREERYLLQEGDVIVGKMRPYKTAVYHVRDGATVLAGGNLYILRPNAEKILPLYLRLFLESDLGVSQMEALTTGTTIPSLPVSAFDEIMVPLPAIEEQQSIVKKCEALTARAEMYERKAQQTRDQIANLLSEGGE